MTFDKKSDYLQKIDKIPNVSFNKEQKQIAKKIIESVDEKDLNAVYGLISQRVKTGFVFDNAPEVNHNCVALIKENEDLNINTNEINTTEHKLIIGENYDALKNLCATYIDKNGKGLIDMIYIDPPYNTEASKQEGNDYKEELEASKFIYRDKFTRDGWLNMMNERLKLARRLLSDKGVIFISIDDTEQAYLKILCDEIFGEENFIKCLIWESGKPFGFKATKTTWPKCHEYILHYVKHRNNMIYNPTYTLETSSNGAQILTSSIIKAKENGIFSMDWVQGAKESVGFGSGQKPLKLLKKLLLCGTNKNSIILDFFAGSGTTGQAVMELNAEDGGHRKFILVTNNENNIGEKITRERLYRVITGKGSKGESFEWNYSKDKPYLDNNSVRVFNIENTELTLNDLDKAESLKDIAKKEFQKLNENYSTKDDFDIYNELSALNPYKKKDNE